MARFFKHPRLAMLTVASGVLASVTCMAFIPAAPASAQAYCAPAANPAVSPESGYNSSYISGQAADTGWGAGDQGLHATLSDGRGVFDWSDTLIYDPAGTYAGFAHNSLLIQDTSSEGAGSQTDVRGTLSKPQSLIPDGSGYWWWLGATYRENGYLLAFTAAYNGSSWTGGAGIASLTTPAYPGLPSYVSGGKWTSLWQDSTRQWGFGFTYDRTYNYLYGAASAVDSATVSHDLYLARVPRGHTTSTSMWQFWNGSGWVSTEAAAAVVNDLEAEAVSPLPSSVGAGYFAVSTGGYPGGTLEIQYACAPQGPWSVPTVIYTVPETNCPSSALEWTDCQYVNAAAGGYELAYQPDVVGYQPSGPATAEVSYSIDYAGDPAALSTVIAHPSMYRPSFVSLNWPVAA